jgi:uncharacterized protein with GYD domain
LNGCPGGCVTPAAAKRARGAVRCYPRRVARSNAAKGAPIRRGCKDAGGVHAHIHVLSQLDRPGRAGGQGRVETIRSQQIAKLGGRLVSAYVTTGQYDVVLTVEMPNGDAMTKFAVSLTSTGNARTTTVRAIPPTTPRGFCRGFCKCSARLFVSKDFKDTSLPLWSGDKRVNSPRPLHTKRYGMNNVRVVTVTPGRQRIANIIAAYRDHAAALGQRPERSAAA